MSPLLKLSLNYWRIISTMLLILKTKPAASTHTVSKSECTTAQSVLFDYHLELNVTWSMVKRTPVADISCCQCRGRMAGFWSSATARREMRRFFTLLSKPVKASHALTCQPDTKQKIWTWAFERDEGAWSGASGCPFSRTYSSKNDYLGIHAVTYI